MSGKLTRFAVEVCGLLLGAVFVFSGGSKAIDPVGGAIKIGEYLSSFGLSAFDKFDLLLAINLAALEFTLGVSLLMGVYRKFVSFITLVFMCFMTPLTLYLALYNPVSDCGCFGEAIILSNWETFAKNIFLLAAAIVVFAKHKCLYQVFTYKTYWFVMLYAYLFGVGFAYANYSHLPLIDFRPYKVGADLIKLTSLPDGALPDEYDYKLIYEKDGEKKEFSVDNYPANDTSWHFVETVSRLVKEGDKAQLPDFRLFSKDGNDVTQDILHSDKPVLLFIISNPKDAYEDKMDDYNAMYDYSIENGIDFYAVSPQDEAAIRRWNDNTGAEYPFIYGDATMLKTMIRSNPGLILFDNGVIIHKWHYNDMPEEEQVGDDLVKIRQDFDQGNKEDRKLLTNILTFAVPLCLVWIYDYFRFRRRKTKKQKD